MYAVALAIALAIGLSLGLLGAGGSILTVPVFHFVLGLEPQAAVASSLVVVAMTSMVALVLHARHGNVRWCAGAMLGTGSMVAAYVGGRVSAHVPGVALIIAFAVVMIAAGVAVVRLKPSVARPHSRLRFVAVGVGVGFLTGMLGAGGGFLLVPAFVLGARLSMREAIGTSLFVVVINSLAALAGAARHTSLAIGLVIPITVLAIAGSLLGAWLGRRLEATRLQRAFGAFLIALGLVILGASR